ncbi:hypothetical protein ONZ45_g6240 [Pleurotus djamor]|nr:hypothetical protein ONZ45_g6240 [Pleurotus djamor]
MSSLLFAEVTALIVAGAVLFQWATKKRPYPFPPGPKPLPILGNALDIPLSRPWDAYSQWGAQYGDLTYVSAFGINVVVINSYDVATELFDGRSNIYSDRPEMPLAQLTGWDMTMATHHYGDTWRKHRSLYHKKFKQESIHQFRPLLTGKAHELLHDLLNDPHELIEHVRNYPAAIVMYICYGHTIARRNDPLVDISDAAAQEVAATILKGSQIVNIIPLARYLPSWFPGFQPEHSAQNNGNTIPSWMSELLQENDANGGSLEQEEIIKAVNASSFAAAHETTSATLQFFIQALILFPEVQTKAQEELDRVLGPGVLPTFDDKPNLPYIEAIYMEVLRWRPPTLIGVPHATSQDDVYRGYLIPKGERDAISKYLRHCRGMCHDPIMFPDPERFMPERFLNDNGTVKDEKIITFGFGRRVCVGSHLAHESIWVAMAALLSVFRFSKAKNEMGEVIEVTQEFSDSLVIFPLPFQYSITPRSESCRQAILKAPRLQLDSLELRGF